MKIKAKEEICINGVWYKPGDELPKDFVIPKQEFSSTDSKERVIKQKKIESEVK